MSSEIEKLMAAAPASVRRALETQYPNLQIEWDEGRVYRPLSEPVGGWRVAKAGFEWDLRAICEQLRSPTAASILEAGLKHMQDRAATYDAPQGERSMAPTVAAFNALTGHELTEEQGWLFMVCLKAARSQQGEFRADNFEDGAAYFGLYGEAAAKRARE